jgi:hypothetical protein
MEQRMNIPEQNRIALIFFEASLREKGMKFHPNDKREIANMASSIKVDSKELLNLFRITVQKVGASVFDFFLIIPGPKMTEDRKGEIARRVLKCRLQEVSFRFEREKYDRELGDLASKTGESKEKLGQFYRILTEEIVRDFFKDEFTGQPPRQ